MITISFCNNVYTMCGISDRHMTDEVKKYLHMVSSLLKIFGLYIDTSFQTAVPRGQVGIACAGWGGGGWVEVLGQFRPLTKD